MSKPLKPGQITFLPKPWPNWVGDGATATQRLRAIKGLHPTGRRIGCHLNAGDVCGRCQMMVRRQVGNTRVIKCEVDRPNWTGGLGTDIRFKWWGCERFLRIKEHNGE